MTIDNNASLYGALPDVPTFTPEIPIDTSLQLIVDDLVQKVIQNECNENIVKRLDAKLSKKFPQINIHFQHSFFKEHPTASIRILIATLFQVIFNDAFEGANSENLQELIKLITPCSEENIDVEPISLHLSNNLIPYLNEVSKDNVGYIQALLKVFRLLLDEEINSEKKYEFYTLLYQVMNDMKSLKVESKRLFMSQITDGMKKMCTKRKIDELFYATLQKSHCTFTVEETEYDAPGKGDCLYWSLTLSVLLPLLSDFQKFQIAFDQLFGTENTFKAPLVFKELINWKGGSVEIPSLRSLVTSVLRNRVVDILETSEHFAPFFTDSGEFNKQRFFTTQRRPGEWAGAHEITAFTYLYPCQIEVIHGDSSYKCGEGEDKFILVHTDHEDSAEARVHYHFRLPIKISGFISPPKPKVEKITRFSPRLNLSLLNRTKMQDLGRSDVFGSKEFNVGGAAAAAKSSLTLRAPSPAELVPGSMAYQLAVYGVGPQYPSHQVFPSTLDSCLVKNFREHYPQADSNIILEMVRDDLLMEFMREFPQTVSCIFVGNCLKKISPTAITHVEHQLHELLFKIYHISYENINEAQGEMIKQASLDYIERVSTLFEGFNSVLVLAKSYLEFNIRRMSNQAEAHQIRSKSQEIIEAMRNNQSIPENERITLSGLLFDLMKFINFD